MAAVLRAGCGAAPQLAVQAAPVAVLEVAEALELEGTLEVQEVLAMVVVAGAAQAVDVSYFLT